MDKNKHAIEQQGYLNAFDLLKEYIASHPSFFGFRCARQIPSAVFHPV